MGNLRKVIASISLVAILSTFAVTNAAFAKSPFTDVPDSHWFTKDGWDVKAKDAGIFTKTTAMPDAKVIRADMAMMVAAAAGLNMTSLEAFPSGVFTDVKSTDYWYKSLQAGRQANVFSEKPKFDAVGVTNRAQAAKVIVQAFGLTPATPKTKTLSDINLSYTGADAWMNNIYTAYCYGLVKGGTYMPGNDVTRAEFAKMLIVAKDAPTLKAECTPGTVVDNPPVVTVEGDLSVGLSDESPVGDTLPSGATSVKMAAWDFTAGSEEAKVSAITVHRYGVWSMPTSHQVYLYDGADRLTSGKNVNSTTNTVVFNNLGVTVAAGKTKTLTLRMDVGDNSAGSTGEVGFEILSEEAVSAGEGTVSGDFPAKAEKFAVSTTPAGTVTVQKNGTITNPKVGEKDVTIAKFKISAATENADLSEFGLYLGGSVNLDDVQDLKLYVTGTTDPIATVDGLNSKDVAQLILDETYRIAKGDTKNFWVTASFNTGRSGDTVLAYVDESTDVVAIGDKYGYGMGVTMTAYDGASCTSAGSYADCTNAELEGGDITISGTSIANRNLAINQDDVTVMKFTIVAATDVTFNNFVMMLDTAATAEATSDAAGLWQDSASNAANFTDIKIKEVNGDHVWGPIDSDVLDSDTAGTNIVDGTDTDQAYYVFSDDLVMAAGESKEFELTLDVENNAALSNESLTAGIYINSSFPELKDVNNKVLTNSTSLVPTGSYTADTFTIKTNSLTIAKSSAVGSATKVIGTNDIQALALSVGAGDASPTKITSITLKGYVDSDGTANGGAFVAGVETKTFAEMVLGVNLYKNSVSPANKLNVSAKSANATTGVITFDNLSWTIPAGDTETLIATVNLANSSSYNNYAVKLDIATVSTDIIAEDATGNSVTSSSADTPNGGVSDAAAYAHIFISSGGTLAVDVPSNTPSAKVAVAGTTGVEFAKLKFTASSESFTLNKLAIRNAYSSTAGDYDDNISALKVKYYTDAAQTTEATTTCASSATSGYFTCSGMTMYVPDTDLSGTPDYAVATIVADLADVASSQADEGDLPEFTLAFNYDLEATGVGSSTKITENTVSVTDAADSAFSATGAASGSLVNAPNEAIDASETVITVDDGTDYRTGDILCIDANDDADCDTTEERVSVVSISTHDLTVVRGIHGTTAATADITDGLLRLAVGSALDTNLMEVRATNMTLTATASRTGSTNVTEQVMTLSAVANPAKDVTLRQGAVETFASDDFTSASFTAAAESGEYVSGSRANTLSGDVADNAFAYLAESTIGGSQLSDYTKVGFWAQVDVDVNASITASGLSFFTNDTADLTAGQLNEVVLNATGSTAPSTFTVGGWHYIELPITPDSTSAFYGIATTGAGTFDAAGDEILIDDIRFFNEKINVDLTLNENWASATPTIAYLKQNGTTVATAYVDFDGVTTSKTGQITFVPVSTYANIEINGTDTFVVEMDTAAAITDDSSSTEKLTAKVDLGAYGTAGDVRWYDGAGTTTYLGVSSTDSVSTVSSY